MEIIITIKIDGEDVKVTKDAIKPRGETEEYSEYAKFFDEAYLKYGVFCFYIFRRTI